MLRFVILLALLFCSASAHASQLVAVLEFRGTGVDEAILLKLSDSVRVAAREVLPRSEYRLMTRENMVQILQDNELDPSCIEGECEVETGRNIGADVIRDKTMVLRIESSCWADHIGFHQLEHFVRSWIMLNCVQLFLWSADESPAALPDPATHGLLRHHPSRGSG